MNVKEIFENYYSDNIAAPMLQFLESIEAITPEDKEQKQELIDYAKRTIEASLTAIEDKVQEIEEEAEQDNFNNLLIYSTVATVGILAVGFFIPILSLAALIPITALIIYRHKSRLFSSKTQEISP